MKNLSPNIILAILLSVLSGCRKDHVNPGNGIIQLTDIRVGTTKLETGITVENIPADQPISITFSGALDSASVKGSVTLKDKNDAGVPYVYSFTNSTSTVSIKPSSVLQFSTAYALNIKSSLKGANGESFGGAQYEFTTLKGTVVIDSISVNGKSLQGLIVQNVDPAKMNFRINFSQPLDPASYKSSITFTGPALLFTLANNNKTVLASTSNKAKALSKYSISVAPSLKTAGDFAFGGYTSVLYTALDTLSYQFNQISDDELLTLVQQQTFKYFWDFGHPVSGMARERNSSGDIVTTGGSGFGIMAMVVAMERGFITRTEGLARLDKILGFLETSDRFHGVWPHWLNGVTGKTQPFSQHDNGGDLVETSYLLQGLICMRQYLDQAVSSEKNEIDRINALFSSVEFDWYTNGEKALYWGWSPDYGYNIKVQGYNETLITYVIAASSPGHSISYDTYTNGYARNGAIKNGKSFYGYLLPLGEDYGGPLFFTHYSFLGLDPHNLKDQYADYWVQDVNQSLISWSYCKADPRNYPGYSDMIWGLTASDNAHGYNAHSPTNDLGVITPTAAISSIVYTPVQSLKTIRAFYYFLGDRLWGNYGFYDAFNVSENWWATSTLAIDQGPEICMIENYRTGLLWNLFMSAPEIKSGLTKLGFTY